MSTREKYDEQVEVAILEDKENVIVLFNDDVNTFDDVIDALVSACDHTPIQAEQCATLVHYKGKCKVKSGSYEDLAPRCTSLLDAGLSAEIQ